MIPFKGKLSKSSNICKASQTHGDSKCGWELESPAWCVTLMSMEYEPNLNLDFQLMLWWSLLPHFQEVRTTKCMLTTTPPVSHYYWSSLIEEIITWEQPGNPNLEDEKSLKKKGGGSYDIRVEGNHNICAVEWYDNRAITLVSSFVWSETVQKILGWDKANQIYI